MTDLEKVLAIESIKKVMAKRIRAMDTKDWVEYDTCHTVDAASDSYSEVPPEHKPKDAIARGKDQILAMIRKIVDDRVKVTSVRHADTPEIELTSSTTAKGIWVLEDRFWWRNGDTEEWFHGFGHYHETYERVGSEWLIKSRKGTRVRSEASSGFYDRFK